MIGRFCSDANRLKRGHSARATAKKSRNGNIAIYQIEEVENRQGLASPRRFFYARIESNAQKLDAFLYVDSHYPENIRIWELPHETIRQKGNGEGVNDDDKFIEQTLMGDSDAFGQLVQKYQDRLFNTLVHIIGCVDEAQDVAQETFLVAFRKLATFQRKSSLYTWLYRIAMNKWISNRRRSQSRISGSQGLLGCNEPVDSTASPEHQMERVEQISQIRSAILELNEQHRTILVLKDIDGCCYEEISGILDIPIGTVRSRLHRARLHLRLRLTQVLQENG